MDKKSALRQFRELKKHSSSMRLAAEKWPSDFQTLVAIMLSARTRDETTIRVAQKLFRKFPTPQKIAKASSKDVAAIIKPVNFFQNKTKNLLACTKTLTQKHNGDVPKSFEELISLPGVGRKTANVFLAEFGDSHIGIDTHVDYISHYLGWTKSKTQEGVENDLKKLFPKKLWKGINPTLVRFGKTHTSRTKKNELLDNMKKL